jgi:hypothetical protein
VPAIKCVGNHVVVNVQRCVIAKCCDIHKAPIVTKRSTHDDVSATMDNNVFSISDLLLYPYALPIRVLADTCDRFSEIAIIA